jgi:phosphate transport system protein
LVDLDFLYLKEGIMAKNHIVKSYDHELKNLQLKILEMGTACGYQLSEAVKSLKNRDHELTKKIIAEDAKVNTLQHEVEQMTINLLAMRQPLAIDLRKVVASLKMASDLERIADYAANMARHVNELNNMPLSDSINIIFDMADQALGMLNDVLGAYQELNIEQAAHVWRLDSEINRGYEELIESLRTMMTEQTGKIRGATALLFIGRSCERIGDHIKNIAEHIHYIVTGNSDIRKSIIA